MEAGYELEKAFQKKNSPPQVIFEDLWPSETKGDGKPRKNNLQTGGAQGKSTLIRKASCRMCGFMVDLTKVDHSGGSIDGNGAGGIINTAVATSNVSGGGTHTENYGSQNYNMNAGCPLCFSKNSTGIRTLAAQSGGVYANPAPLGF